MACRHPRTGKERMSSPSLRTANAQSRPTPRIFTAEYMASLLRRRVQIYFKDDPQPKWYDGEVAEYSQTDKQHLIRFDDGDQNWYDIDAEESATTLRWLEPTVALKSKRTQPVRPEAEDVAKKQRGTVTGKRGQTQVSQTLMSPVSVLAPAQTLMLAPGATSWTETHADRAMGAWPECGHVHVPKCTRALLP